MSFDEKLLSFLLPAYNVSEYIEECLTSIICQIDDSHRFEIIILDDASSDRTFEICQRYKECHGGNIKILRHESNKGVSAVRNALIQSAAGKYIWFVDADDKLMPGAVASMAKVLATNDVDMIVCDYVRGENVYHPTLDGVGWQVEHDTEKLLEGVFRNRRLHLWTKIFRRSLFDGGIRFPEGACFEDIAVVPWLLLRAKTYIHVPEAWVYYRSRPGSIMALVARSGRSFNRRLNEDLATALSGFGLDLERTLPVCSDRTKIAISVFLAREYAKIGKRYLWARGGGDGLLVMRREMGRYLTLMESESPVPFRKVASFYLRKGRLIRWFALRFYLAFALPNSKTVSVW